MTMFVAGLVTGMLIALVTVVLTAMWVFRDRKDENP